MDSAKATVAAAAPAPPSNGRKHHKPSSSLGSLYEVLADLDENQLDYLLQEMNHTGHQNVKVSQAVTALDSQSPPESMGSIRANMLPSAPNYQSQTSPKSQQGKLRLQTAFQRAPSLKQRQPTERRGSQQHSIKPAQDPATESPKPYRLRSESERRPSVPAHSPPPPQQVVPQQDVPARIPSPELEIQMPKRGSVSGTASARRPTTSSVRSISAYKRISRPDFNLPPGITVPDLLQLLETEFLSSSHSRDATSPTSPYSTASPIPSHGSPSPFLSASLSMSRSPSPASIGPRTLRKHSSRLNMALEAERNASGIEEIGLGMLEPRASPLSTASLGRSSPITPIDTFSRGFGRETPPNPSPLVLEGIFDVLENR